MNLFEQSFDQQELAVFFQLNSPYKIQVFLDEMPYSEEDIYRCPRSVIRDRKAHCFDGALFAAAALRRLDHPPLVLDMLPEKGRDDDHMLAVYKFDGHWGAIGKSNFVGLRFREPVYRTLRELIFSYFEVFFNVQREKTLRGYTAPLNLQSLDHIHWMTSDERLISIEQRLNTIRRYPVLTESMTAQLALVDERSYQAGLLGANWAGLYKLPDTSR